MTTKVHKMLWHTVTTSTEDADADEAIEKAVKEYKVIASKLIAVPRR